MRPHVRVTFDDGFSWYVTRFHMASESKTQRMFALDGNKPFSIPSQKSTSHFVFEDLTLEPPKIQSLLWANMRKQRLRRLSRVDPGVIMDTDGCDPLGFGTACAFMHSSISGQRWCITGLLKNIKAEGDGLRAEMSVNKLDEYTRPYPLRDDELEDLW